ncbi:vWA domain-containing protein [Archangium primigenium]|uniref:vWA domain-containing protein n=1 Tax=[Archangium] primigenium TaxID=2792470 RepID=UPI0019593403|nr:von Willebrand factor type A domain-containing protein [Archangium primigenium]MBM7114027.1 von Willebrand factor type A domain-containing protein [Archangium primigenium]
MKKYVSWSLRILGGLLLVGLLLIVTLLFFGNNIRRFMGLATTSMPGEEFQPPREPRPLQDFSRNSSKRFKPSEALATDEPVPGSPRRAGSTHEEPPSNPYICVSHDRFSTFAVDVDTAAYTLFRRSMAEGRPPPRDAVRVAEWVNYFQYRYPAPQEGDFHVDLEGAPSPYTPGWHLIKVGVQGRVVPAAQRKPAHLVFLVNTGDSMSSQDKLPLAQKALKLLVRGLNPQDTVALVTSAGGVRDVLPPTPATERDTLFTAIDSLSAKGSATLGSGLELAYRHAARHARPDRVSRVIVLTDGDAHLDGTSASVLYENIRGYVQEGVTLSTVGFGLGGSRDGVLDRLAAKGNGHAYYIDSEDEARRLFQDKLSGTLEVIAQDVKVQVEFNPDAVNTYRLMGYEDRDLADKDFRDDKVDAGEIGAGHTVTALYEVKLVGTHSTLALVRVRAKRPGGVEAAEQRFLLERGQVHDSLQRASANLRFAAAVAGTADILRGESHAESWNLAAAEVLTEAALDGMSDRAEFLGLLRRLRGMVSRPVTRATP